MVFVIEGSVRIELKDGRVFTIGKGMSFQVGDNIDEHLASTEGGARVLIVD